MSTTNEPSGAVTVTSTAVALMLESVGVPAKTQYSPEPRRTSAVWGTSISAKSLMALATVPTAMATITIPAMAVTTKITRAIQNPAKGSFGRG